MQELDDAMMNTHWFTSVRAFSPTRASGHVGPVAPRSKSTWNSVRIGFTGLSTGVLFAGGALLPPKTLLADHVSRGFIKDGKPSIADQFNHGVADGKVDVSKLPPPSDQKDLLYAKDVRPIFEKSCFKCHDAAKHKGRLRLDSLEAALKGGEDGKVVTPGNSAQSVLVHRVARVVDGDDWMPPKGKGEALTKEQVSLIRAWIDQGAK